jgi:hypothetical protein
MSRERITDGHVGVGTRSPGNVRRPGTGVPLGPPDTEQTLWCIRRGTELPISAVLASYGPAVELHLYCGETLRRQLRFLSDLPPVKYAERLRTRLEARGYREGRRDRRAAQWLV